MHTTATLPSDLRCTVLLPMWQVSLVRQHFGYLLCVHLLAVFLFLFVISENVSARIQGIWGACLLITWGCTALWVKRVSRSRYAAANPLWALRMLAMNIVVWSSPWVIAPTLFLSEDLPNQIAAVCVLVVLAAAASQILAAHFTAAVASTVCILLPAALMLVQGPDDFHLRMAICVIGFLCMTLLICFRSAQIVLDNYRLRLASEHMVRQLLEQVQAQQYTCDKTEQALVLAEQACKDKTRFLASASHDLRQPIHAISLFVAALKSEVFESHTRYLVDRLDRALSGLDSLFNCLLDISRLDAGLVTPAIRPVDAQVIAQTLESRFMPVATNKLLDFRVRCQPGLQLRSDPDLLVELLSNLLANAFRYTQNGGVLLSFRAHHGQVRIRVWDTGCGIPEGKLESIFDEFTQLNNPARDRRRGLGLGLAIVKRLAHMLGHGLEVHSRLGRGSAFGLLVERAADAGCLQYGGAPETQPKGNFHGTLVLVVDDEIDILAAMEALLASWGCLSILARSPEEAAKYVESSLRFPDLIITDHRLDNHQTSADVAAAVAPLIPYPVPTIVISGESHPYLATQIEDNGWVFMSKPVNVECLRVTISRVLGDASATLNQAA